MIAKKPEKLASFVNSNLFDMWQRIQTLYLVVAIALCIFLFSLTLAEVTIDGVMNVFDIFGLIGREIGGRIFTTYTVAILNVFSILLSLIVIFLFKRRQLQIKLCQLNMVVQLAMIAVFFFMVDAAVSKIQLGGQEAFVEYSGGSVVILAPIVFVYLALRAIKRDEALIRSADRLR